MRKNFNFKAEWAVAIQSLGADIRLCVYQVILTMGLHEMSLSEALAVDGVVINDDDAMNLLVGVEKVLARRRRARERAAARRIAKNAALNMDKSAEKDDVMASPVAGGNSRSLTNADNPDHEITDCSVHNPGDAVAQSPADSMTSPAPTRRRRHKHKKRKSRRC